MTAGWRGVSPARISPGRPAGVGVQILIEAQQFIQRAAFAERRVFDLSELAPDHEDDEGEHDGVDSADQRDQSVQTLGVGGEESIGAGLMYKGIRESGHDQPDRQPEGMPRSRRPVHKASFLPARKSQPGENVLVGAAGLEPATLSLEG